MNLREQQNIFKLLWEGLGLVNRAGTALVIYIIVFVLLNFLPMLLMHFNIPSLFIQLFNLCISSFLVILLWRTLASKADNFGESFSNSITASIIPGVYLLIFNLIIGLFTAIFTFIAIPFVHLTHKVGLVLISLFSCYVMVRLCFAVPALALREQGPIKAIIYSWEMTRGIKNFFSSLLIIVVCTLLPTLFLLVVGRILYVTIPLYFANSFNLAELTAPWYLVFGICFLGFVITVFWSFASFLLFFLNYDYGENRGSYTPEPEAQLTSQTTQVFGENNNVLPPGLGKIVTQQDVENLTVTKSSVKTVSDENELKEHLEQVYQPKPEDFIQYDEEDRMPTILFDDEMAKQIEENRQMWSKKAEKKDPDSDEGTNTQSIKMSK